MAPWDQSSGNKVGKKKEGIGRAKSKKMQRNMKQKELE